MFIILVTLSKHLKRSTLRGRGKLYFGSRLDGAWILTAANGCEGSSIMLEVWTCESSWHASEQQGCSAGFPLPWVWAGASAHGWCQLQSAVVFFLTYNLCKHRYAQKRVSSGTLGQLSWHWGLTASFCILQRWVESPTVFLCNVIVFVNKNILSSRSTNQRPRVAQFHLVKHPYYSRPQGPESGNDRCGLRGLLLFWCCGEIF